MTDKSKIMTCSTCGSSGETYYVDTSPMGFCPPGQIAVAIASCAYLCADCKDKFEKRVERILKANIEELKKQNEIDKPGTIVKLISEPYDRMDLYHGTCYICHSIKTLHSTLINSKTINLCDECRTFLKT